MFQLREVVIETTKICNLHCIHCGSNCEQKPGNDELSIAEWKGLLVQLAEMKVAKVVFSGGEPTLKKSFEELLIFCANVGLRCGFISNALYPFSQKLQEAIKKSKPFAVGVSIDGLKETHNTIRQHMGSWHGLMENISILKDLKVQICAVTTLHKMNFRQLPRLAVFLDLAEIDSWQIQLAMPSGRMKANSDLLIEECDYKEICLDIVSLRRSYPNINIQAADCFGPAPKGFIRSQVWGGCMAGIASIGIDSFGNVMPCLSLQDYPVRESTKEKTILEIWKSSAIFGFNRKFKAKNVKGRCQDCNFLKDCRGGCNSQSLSSYGILHSSPFCFIRTFNQKRGGEKNEQRDRFNKGRHGEAQGCRQIA